MKRGKSRYERFSVLRAEGLTYREIAERYGCSEQNVSQVLSVENKKRFHYFSEKSVIYNGLREWLNENKVSVSELIRRKYGYHIGGEAHYYMTARLSGKTRLNMDDIEFFLRMTGKTYEELFHKPKTEGDAK